MFTSTLLFSCEKKNNLAETPIRLTETHQPAIATDETNGKIQVAILLDTSNSMDGLIEQAKSRLWNIVNTLTTLKFEGKTPEIEIALYEYGNDGLNKNTDYIRQVAPLTTDLDLISEKLFSLRTNGGSEYCGAVIQDASQRELNDQNPVASLFNDFEELDNSKKTKINRSMVYKGSTLHFFRNLAANKWDLNDHVWKR